MILDLGIMSVKVLKEFKSGVNVKLLVKCENKIF